MDHSTRSSVRFWNELSHSRTLVFLAPYRAPHCTKSVAWALKCRLHNGDVMIQDLRPAIRQLFAAPEFCIAVVLTLALGIGVNSGVFSMLDGFLLRQLPYPEPDRIAALVVHKEGLNSRTGRVESEEDNSFNGDSWELLKENVDGLAFAAWGGNGGVNLKSDTDGGARYVRAARVSANYFEVLGIPLSQGRSFSVDEDRPHGAPVVVLSYTLWNSTFRQDTGIIGKTIHLKGEPYTVIGVLARSAMTPSHADLFTALKPAPTGECGGENCGIIVRLKRGANWKQVNSQLSHVRLPFFSELESRAHGRSWLYARPLQLELAADMKGRVSVLMWTVLFILLIACANLAGLALVRICRREQEIATRLALGASRWNIIRQLWMENLMLALLGGAAGVGCAGLMLDYFGKSLPEEMIPMGGLSLNLHVVAFAFGASLVTSLLFGALPAMQSRGIDLRSAITSGSRTIARGSSRFRQLLIVGQVAITIVLLAAAGLMIRTLLHLETQAPGFDPRHVITAKASLDDARYRDTAAFHELMLKSVDAMRGIAGVEEAAVGLSVPYERGLNDGATALDGKLAGAGGTSSLAYVTPGYFSALRIPILSGRVFTDRDTPTSAFVAVVNQMFSRKFFREAAPLGRHIRTGKSSYTIVGVTQDVAKRPGAQPIAPIATEPVFYLPATQMEQAEINAAHVWFEPSWIVRSQRADQAGLTQQMQRAMAAVDPNLPFSAFHSMAQILHEQLEQQRIEVAMLTTLSALALLLSSIGIYALVSNLVVQRTREIGIRIALGSTVRQAMLHIGSVGIVAALVGALLGVGLSFLTLRVLESELYGIKVYDPLTLTSVPVLLAFIAVFASFLPTLRIARLHPADTLRAE